MIDFNIILILATDIILYHYLILFIKSGIQKMKNQKYVTIILILTIIIIILLQACEATNKVSNSRTIQKRKYNNGFYVDFISSKKTKSINQNNEKQLVIKMIDLQDNKKQQQTRSFYLNNEKDSIIEKKDVLFSSLENIVLYPSFKESPHFAFKNKTIQAKQNNNNIGKEFISGKKMLNTRSKPILYSEKHEINKIALIGFILATLGLLTLFLSFYFSFVLGMYLSLLFSIPAIPLSIIGFTKGRMNAGKVFGIIGFILGILGYFAASVYYFWSLYVSLEGCSIM